MARANVSYLNNHLGVVQKHGNHKNIFELKKLSKSPCEEGFKFSVFSKVLPEFESRPKYNSQSIKILHEKVLHNF
jgi:hypothetical protein